MFTPEALDPPAAAFIMGAHRSAAPVLENFMAKSKKAFNFEQALGDLETLVTAMESGEMSLEESLEAFETGIRLTRECQEALKLAEQKVQLLLSETGETTAFALELAEGEEPA